ncbi:MAG: 3-oxoacyl-[acyl-carrier protein] reductase, partial [Labilithrix sp.]|nr:3-oxoacyl-[acyl-carrier protein] reductase [Labilithrix sp.]
MHSMIKGAAVVVAVAQAASMAVRASRGMNLEGKTALVCGASRGLGRQIALALARRGCRVAICARSERDLDDVRAELVALGVAVHAESCDLRSMEQVEVLVANATAALGPIDLLVPVAATLLVGPIETMTVADFDDAMDSIFKTSLHPALAVLPRMQARKAGTIAFITSIGGKIGVPHLVPYSAAKFAEVGLAEGLRAEVAKDGVHVLTVVPGLMRTGSHVHAEVKGDAEKEYAWFGASATAPMPLTIDAARAARRIVRAIERGDTELVLTPAAKLAVRANGIAPGLVSLVMKLAGRLLPRAPALSASGRRRREGMDVEESSPSKGVAFVRG